MDVDVDADTVSEERRHRFTVAEVTKLSRAGFFDDRRLELIEGDLLDMTPPDPPHANPIDELNMLLTGVYRDGYRVRVQHSLRLSKLSLPQPDLVVARGDRTTYAKRHPRGADCVLVIEVSWSSRRRDLRKSELYGSGGVPIYWRLDVRARTLEVYEQPLKKGGYATKRVLAADDEVDVPETQLRWKVADLLVT